MKYARISITLPHPLLVGADQRAGSLGRSRSWVISQALSAYLAEEKEPGGSHRVREAPSVGYVTAAGLGDQRLAQLRADLTLTPEQRVIEAERTARAVTSQTPRWAGVLTFDRFEDYLAWKRRETAGP